MSHFTPAGLPSASLLPSPINMIKVGFCDSSYLLAPSTSRTLGRRRRVPWGLGSPSSERTAAPRPDRPPRPPHRHLLQLHPGSTRLHLPGQLRGPLWAWLCGSKQLAYRPSDRPLAEKLGSHCATPTPPWAGPHPQARTTASVPSSRRGAASPCESRSHPVSRLGPPSGALEWSGDWARGRRPAPHLSVT